MKSVKNTHRRYARKDEINWIDKRATAKRSIKMFTYTQKIKVDQEIECESLDLSQKIADR